MRVLCEDIKRYIVGWRNIRSLNRPEYRLNQAGFSLIELVVTIAIMGTVMAIATLSFNSWQTKNKIESQTREIFTDLADARTRAYTQKRVHGIVFQPSSYVMKSYSSEVEYSTTIKAATNGVQVWSKSLKYGITKTSTATAFTNANSSILFDTTGFTSVTPSSSTFGFTIVVNPVSVSPSLNCLVIHVSRVNMGKWNETTNACDFK